MELHQLIQPGQERKETFAVTEQHSAAHVGSGAARVLATPWLIAFMEHTARLFLDEALPAGYSSVGVHVDVRHLAPTPVGGRVRVTARLEQIDGMQVDFSVAAWDEQEQVGSGRHRRVVIDEARFLRRVAAKAQALSGAGQA
jgi:predicted thioesterase